LETLAASGKALSQDEIERRVKLPIDKVTIYRVLNRFCEDGVLHKIIAENGKQYFAICLSCDESNLAPNHFHFRCINCQTIECLKQEVKYSIPRGYSVQSVNCLLTGICKDCRRSAG
jgi:Fur family transcriptional regulator, ferric uptake regulator